jgi:hypothetical protein
LIKKGVEEQYDIIMFGHTHVALHEQFDKLLLLNPGSCSRPRNLLPPTYLIVYINEHDISYSFRDAYTNETIEF